MLLCLDLTVDMWQLVVTNHEQYRRK